MRKSNKTVTRIRYHLAPMLATLVPEPVNKPGWVYEEKYDGDRIIAYKEGDRVHLWSRNHKDRTERFPGIVAAISRLRPRTLLLDGEVVVFDRKGVSRFQLLQQKGGEFVYVVFDCLYRDGADLRALPLAARRAALEASLGRGLQLRVSRRLAANGLAAYRLAKRRGYEGLVAKDSSSPYIETRSKFWLKVKVHLEDEFIICGYTKPRGSRQHFGALLLGAYRADTLRYVGKVGTGFDVATLAALWKRFQPWVKSRTVLVNPPRDKDVVFIASKLVAQISYQEWTSDQKLRQPVFLGLRDDKAVREVRMAASAA